MSNPVIIGNATLYQGDCLDVLRMLPDASIDAVVIDPPYCSGGATESSRGRATHQGLRTETMKAGRLKWFDGDNMTTAGLVWLLREVAVEAKRITKDSGHLLVFCDWRMAFSLGPALESAGLRLRNLVAWDKGHFGCGTGFRPQHELIIHLTNRAPAFHSASVGNVIKSKRVGKDRQHPTEKPIDLIEQMLDVVCPHGGTVADCFMGSGSTGVAAINRGARFIGIEREAEYIDIACRRIEDAQRQQSLDLESVA